MPDFNAIRFLSGRPLLKELGADRLNTILTEIKRNKPKGERGITVRQDGTGTYIGLAASLPRGGGTSTARAWDIVSSPDGESENEWTLQVRPGTLARVLPTNWDEEFSASGEDTLHYGIATATTDGRAITGVTISITTTAPELSEPLKYAIPEEVEFVFGLFQGGKSYNLTNGADIDVLAVATLATSADPPAQPGESPYDIYFRLQ